MTMHMKQTEAVEQAKTKIMKDAVKEIITWQDQLKSKKKMFFQHN